MNKNDKLNKVCAAVDLLKDSLNKCAICPRRCGVNRSGGKLGYCRAPFNPVIYSYIAHHGEEPAISGRKGSGTIFFTHCNMKCVYCQNYIFSQLDNGEEVSIERLASIILKLQDVRCHNINLVSPTHFVPQILMALKIAIEKGLNIPIVYNTSGYDSLDTIKLLDGIIDIYMPDMRYSDNRMAKLYSDAPNYVEHDRACICEMQRQVGDLVLDEKGVAIKGLIIRLLVLPNDVSGTADSLKFINKKISKNTYLSIMSQYYPTYKAHNFKEISCGVTEEEYEIKVDEAQRIGLNNGWIQEMPERPDERFLGINIKPKNDKKDQ
jgi:putative pyruvate formate lyase activating enzyme